MKKVAILVSHPIQYQVPWFRALAAHPDLNLHVFFAHQAKPQEQGAAGFGVVFEWDIPLLEGYPHTFLKNIARTPSVSTFFGLDTPEIRTFIACERYDAVVVNGWHYKSAWQAIWACWHTKTPVMVRSDSHLYTKRHLLKRAMKWPLYRYFIPRFDACLPVGQWSSEYFRHYGAKPDRIFVIPHTVDQKRFTRAHDIDGSRASLRAEWQLDASAIVFLFTGKLIDKKRPMDFVRAVGAVSARGFQIQGLIVGDGPLRGECETFVKSNRIPIRFAGFLNQSDMPKVYAAADCLVLPSDGGETWGLVVNEAMSCGLPAIVSDCIGCGPDLIDRGITGDTFPMGSVESLASVMAEWTNRTRCRSAQTAVKRKIAGHSVQRAVNTLLEAVNAMSSGTRKSIHSAAPILDHMK
jgi:glycosyltransferase involved in cell wall biosynthesis